MALSIRGVFLVVCLVCLEQSSLFAQTSAAEREFNFASKIYEDSLFSLAANEFRTFVDRFPNDTHADDAAFLSGDAYFRIGEYEQAFQLFKTLELSYPQSDLMPKARMLMAQSQLNQHDYAAAAELFRRAAYFHPESDIAPRALLQSADAYRLAGQFEKALSTNLRVLSNYPTSPERLQAHLQIIGLYADQGAYSQAIAQSDLALKSVGPGLRDPRVYQLRAEIYEKTGQISAAESLYEQIVGEFPQTDSAVDAIFHLARLRRDQGDLSGALTHLDKFLAVSKGSGARSEALVTRGLILQQLGRDAEALPALRQAAATGLDELSSPMRLRLGVGLVKAGEYSTAGVVLQKLVGQDTSRVGGDVEPPDEIRDAYYVLARVFLAEGNAQKMLTLTRLYERRHPESGRLAALMMLKGSLYETVLHNYSAALRVYQNVVEDFPKQAEIDAAQFQIAQCYEKLGDYHLALQEYRNYLDRYPGGGFFEEVRDKMAVIEATIPLDSDNGLQQVTSLYLTLSKSTEHPEFAIAKTSFQLKSFQAAIGQLKELLKEKDDSALRSSVFSYLGKSYFRSGQKAGLLGNTQLSHALYDSAAISLGFVAQNEPNGATREEADYLLVRLALADTSTGQLNNTLEAAYERWLQEYPQGTYKNQVLGWVARNNLERAPEDTTALQRALTIYQSILSDETAEHRGDLYDGFLQCLQLRNQDSLMVTKASEFIARHARSDYLPRLLLRRASGYEATGDTLAALKDLRRIHSEFFYAPEAKTALLEIGELQMSVGRNHAAANTFSTLLGDYERNHPEEALSEIGLTALRERAIAYDRLTMNTEALRDYVTFIVNAPHDHAAVTQTMLSVARIARQQHNDTFAEEFYENVLTGSPSAQEAFIAQVSIADINFDKKLFADAITGYNLARKLAPNESDRRYTDARIIRATYKSKHIQAGDALVATFRQSYKKDDSRAQFLLDKADAYRASKSFEAAADIYEKVKDDFENTDFGARGEFGLGAVEMVTNHTEEALKILTAIPSKYPNSEVTPLAYYNLGDFYYKSKQLQNAIQAFTRTMKHPKSGELLAKALLYLTKCYKDARMWDQAIALTRKYIETYPDASDNFERRIDLGQLLMSLKEYDRAITHFRKILPYADVESEAAIQFYIAQSYKEIGSLEQAASEFLKVKYLTPETKLPWHVTAMFETGKCMVSLKRFAQAKQIFQRIVSEEGESSNFGQFAIQQLDKLKVVTSGTQIQQ